LLVIAQPEKVRSNNALARLNTFLMSVFPPLPFG
jgi:hypothetical protein